MMEPRAIEIVLPGSRMTLRGLSWAGSGTPILALHGWLDNAASFEPLASQLGGRPVVALDFPGHGLSDHLPPGGLYHFIDGVFVIQEIEKALGWSCYILLGHSMGGATASLYASSQPAAVRALVLLEGLGPLSAPVEETHPRFVKHLAMRAALGDKELPVYRSVEDAVRARTIATGVKGPVIRGVIERGLKPWQGGFTWRSDPRVTIPSPMRFMEPQVENLFRQIAVPTFHLMASNGILTANGPFPAGQREAWIKDLTTEHLAGGHHVHLERPAEVATLIRDFLQAKRA